VILSERECFLETELATGEATEASGLWGRERTKVTERSQARHDNLKRTRKPRTKLVKKRQHLKTVGGDSAGEWWRGLHERSKIGR